MSVYFYGCMTLDGYLADKNHGLTWLDQTGDVEETGILVTIRDIYPEKMLRYVRWIGWRENLKRRREIFRQRLFAHFPRMKRAK